MAKKRAKSKQEQEYKHQLKLAKDRARRWQKTKRIAVSIETKKKSESYTKAAERLKNIRLSQFSEQELQEYRTNYQEQYEKGEIKSPYTESEYSPPTEDDYYADYNGDYWYEEPWDETPNKPAISTAEIDAFIEQTEEEILDVTGIDRPNEVIRGIFRVLLGNLHFSLGDEEYYKYLSNPAVVNQLTEAAQTGMSVSPTKATNGAEKATAQDAINKFTTVLNMGQPLDIYQSRQLSEVVETEGYNGGVIFEFTGD